MIPYGDGPSGEIRTPGVLNPNQVPYQLGHTRRCVNRMYYTRFFRKSNPKLARPGVEMGLFLCYDGEKDVSV